MSGTNVGNLLVRLLLERDKFRADLQETAADAEAGANRVTRAAGAITDAVADAAQGQANVASMAARSLSILGPAAGVAVAAAVAVGVAYHQAQKENEAYQRSIILTGNAAGVTAGQLSDMARRIDGVAGTHAQAAAALAQMTGTAQVARGNLEKVSLAAIEMERASVQSIGESVKVFADLGKAPVAASLRLNESMNYLTASTFEQIKAAEQMGRAEEAASIAQNAYADAARERTAKVEQNLGTLQKVMRSVREAASKMWDSILNIGREQTNQERLDATRKRIADLENQIAGASSGFGETGGGAATGRARSTLRLQAELSGLQAQAAALEGVAYQARASAEAEREKQAAENAGIALSTEASKHDSALEKQRKAVAQATAQYTTAIQREGMTQQERAQIDANYLKIVSSLTQEKEKAAKPRGARKDAGGDPYAAERAGAQEWAKVMATAGKAVETLEGKTQGLNAAQQALLGYLGSPAYAQNTEDMRQAALTRLYAWDAAIKHADATKAEAEAVASASKAMATWQDASAKETQGLKAQVAARKEEAAALGLSAVEVAGLTAAKHEQAAAEKEAYAAALESAQLYAGEYSEAYATAAEAAREQARLLRELAGSEVSTAGRRAMLDEWKQTVDKYDDVFRTGFADMLNSGKDGWKSFTKSLATTFKTTVADQLYKAFAQPFVVNVVGNLLGLSGAGGAAGAVSAGSNLLGMASNASSLYSAFTGNGLIGNTIRTVGGWLGLGGGAATGLGLSAATGAGVIGSGIGAGLGLGSAAAGAGTGLGLSLGGTGLGLSAGSAGAGAIGAGLGTSAAAGGAGAAAGAGAGGISGALAAVPVWGWALAGAAAIAAIFGKKSTPHMGAGSEYSAATGLQSNRDIYASLGFTGKQTWSDDVQKSITAPLAQSIGQTLDGFANAFGSAAGFEVATAFADDKSKDGAWGALRIRQGGKSVLDWGNPDDKWAGVTFANGEDGIKEYMAKVAADVRDVLKTSAPGWVDTMLDSLGDAPSMDNLSAVVQQIGQLQAVFESFGQYMPTFASLADSAVDKLVQASGGAGTLAANMASFVDGFYSDAEKLAINTANVRAAMAELGFEMPQTRDEFRALVQAQLSLGDAGAQTAAGLLALSNDFKAVTQAAEDTSQVLQSAIDATDAAFATLQRSVSAARDAAQAEIELREQRLATAQAVVDLARDQARDLRGLVDSTVGRTAAQASAWIDSAVAAARTGALPDVDLLGRAVEDARAGMDASAYSNRLDYEAAQLILANKLDVIGDAGAAQVDVNQLLLEQAKNEVERLDMIIKNGQAALDAARGNTEAVLSVETAVREFYARMFEEKDKGGAGAGGSAGGGPTFGGGGSGGGGGGGAWGAVESPYKVPISIGTATGDEQAYMPVTDAERIARLDLLNSGYHAFDGTGNAAGLNEWIQSNSVSAADLSALSGLYERDWANWFSLYGIPAFAGGGDFPGGLRLVGEQGPELEATGPSRIYSASQTRQLLAGLGGNDDNGGSEEVVRAINALRTMLSDALAAIYLTNSDSEKLLRRLEALGFKQRAGTEGVPA